MKKIISLFCLICSTAFVFGQSVSEEELKSIADRKTEITFENYVGPTSAEEFNTMDQISAIGSFMASQEGTEIIYGNKYKIIRSYQPEIKEGLDGDILFILPDAAVDHIRNLRSIIASYLKATFGYSDSNAAVLSEFVTYYNAVYYKNLDHFSSRYKEGVLKNLDKNSAGLSKHYSEWAGKSRIVIPLKSGDGTIQSSLDTSTISEPDVIEEMQKEDDKALDSRKEMVEIREDELDSRQETVDEEKKIVEEKEAVIQEKEDTVDQAVEDKKEELEQVEEGSLEEDTLEEELDKLEEEKADIEEEKEAVEQEKAAVEEKQEQIDDEQKEIVEMREDIAKDENELAKEEGVVLSSADEKEVQGFWFILVDKSADPAPFGSIVKVTETGDILQKSELNSVRGTSFIEGGEGLIVIAGKNEERSRVKALILDTETLDIIKEADHEIYPGSSIWTEGDNLFMITRNEENWSVGMFSKSLELKNLSTVTVHPDTGLVFVDGIILVQSDSGTIEALKADNLSAVEVIE